MSREKTHKTPVYEVNFDGLVGPNHNYAGLAYGNVASQQHGRQISYPKAAAKQGLLKMKVLMDLGVMQGIIPPQERPALHVLRQLGFSGTDEMLLKQAYQSAPHLLAACYSASSMWTANAATVSPSADTRDHKVHFTPANLFSYFHRSLEVTQTQRFLKTVFSDSRFFHHHESLPSAESFSDEGAANHSRLCIAHGAPGIEFFVFGRYAFDFQKPRPKKFPARQSFEASEAIARLHQLDERRCFFLQQNPSVIDEGVFHNDVIAVANENVLLYHEDAFLHANDLDQMNRVFPGELHLLKIARRNLSVSEAVASYLFNSQLVTFSEGKMALIAPFESQENERVQNCIAALLAAPNPIKKIHYVDCRQSMYNGGGPACLRLRVCLTESELKSIQPRVILDTQLWTQLNDWVDKHYRDELTPKDLLDPKLIEEIQRALDELTTILALGNFYDFQKIITA